MRKTIAIFRTGGVGDVILSTVAINIVKEYLPNTKLIWIGREPVNTLIRESYSDVVVVDIAVGNSYAENAKLILESSGKIDAVIDLQHSARTFILGHWVAFKKKCSYTSWNKYSIERSLLVLQSYIRGRKFEFDLFPDELPNRYLAMGNCTKKALKKLVPDLNTQKQFTPKFDAFNQERKDDVITICLGAKFLTKALPASKVAEILRILISQVSLRTIYFLGEENQFNVAEELMVGLANHIHFINKCGITSLVEAAQILSLSKFALVNDSGLAHLAEAVNTPVITFFGPTHQKFGYRPHLSASITLSEDIGCRPCNKNGDVKCRYKDHACSAMLDTASIHSFIQSIYA